MDRLIVICEGGVHTIEYLHRNGVFPSAMVIEPNKFSEMSPYLTKDDDILLILTGLTDFTMSNVYALMSKFKEHEDKFKRVTILSNIPLGAIPYDYYLYKGDLFYGTVKKVSNNKVLELDENGNIEDQKKSFKKKKKKKSLDDLKQGKNPIMFQFKKYNDKKTRIMIYGKVTSEHVPAEQFEYETKITLVDLFNKQ